ncbi:site-specific integrase [Clostridium sp. OS1-26]|uniref:tyrosine-type recombinase/integrase n=1 Tax=Clostridium sp. OS1-26 TaxID=3070681 RepID=UPI0027E04F08|nr:site-specific integrase [Clostridium sp. OS1-26]WML35672.1 site-specific integrase [Clostridium sp. OS1-26]
MPKARSKANGEGTIYKYEKNGKTYYRGMLTIGYDEDGKLIRKSFNGSKKQEVVNKMAEYKTKSNAGLLPSDDKITLQQWFYTWLFDFRINDLKPSSLERYEGIYRNYIKDTQIGKKKLSDLRAADIQMYYNSLSESNKTADTIKMINKNLKTCLNEALKQGLITKNYCTLVTLPKVEKKDEITVFSVEEQKSLINYLEGHRLKMLLAMALGTGMRQGELLGLKWSDIAFDNNTVSINKSIKLVYVVTKNGSRESKIIEQTPKTKNSIRTIPVPSKVMDELKQYKEFQNQEKINNKDLYLDNNIVFATELGAYLDSRYLTKRYTSILKKADIPYKKFHSLRHTYCTRLFEAGIPIKIVQMLMGHGDIKTTMNIYTHVMPDEKIKAVEKINNLF